MPQPITFSTKVRGWGLLRENLRPYLEEMPFLQPLFTEIESFVTAAEALHGEQELARARFRDITHRRQKMEQEGELLRRRVESHLRGVFGFVSDELVKFGMKPRPTGKRRKKAAPAGTETESAKPRKS
ncbi:MAG TPA: hypothetical protein VF756_27885 [Thermoanaerobaculia bacterium]